MNKTIELINGNGNTYIVSIPKLYIIETVNEAFLYHIYKSTGLNFDLHYNGISAQPESAEQILKLLLTYNFKIQYHDNATNHNTIFLKLCSDDGFNVASICKSCAQLNNITNANKLKKTDILRV